MISTHDQRIIYSDNGALTDKTLVLNNPHGETFAPGYTAGVDYIFIGSTLPFNHKYIHVAEANVATSTMTVEIWYSDQWTAAVDVMDQTAVAGASLVQSGIVQWNTHRNRGWDKELDSEDVTGLTATAVYGMYWVRLSFSANLTETTEISYIGHKFSTDADLYRTYPDLNNEAVKESFETGKADWDAQSYLAADEIIRALKDKGTIVSPAQLLDYEAFREASVHKTAELIYIGMGQAYAEQRKTAKGYYETAINRRISHVDLNRNGVVDTLENQSFFGRIFR